MQLIKRLGDKAFPVVQQSCTGVGFNCTAQLAVTAVASSSSSSIRGVSGVGVEALLVNHPTGVVNMRSFNASLPPVTVTIQFSGGGKKGMPSEVTVRRVDERSGNALPLYTALGAPQYVHLLRTVGVFVYRVRACVRACVFLALYLSITNESTSARGGERGGGVKRGASEKDSARPD